MILLCPDEKIESMGYTPVSKEELFKRSDIVTVHLRLTKDPLEFVGQGVISFDESTAYFVNTARSGIVDTDSLIDALNQTKHWWCCY